MKCDWCGSRRPFEDDWVVLSIGERSKRFCHGGCLVYWLHDEEPRYFHELLDYGLLEA